MGVEIREQQTFRVIILVPVHPEGTFKDNPGVRYIMKASFSELPASGANVFSSFITPSPVVANQFWSN